MHISHSNPIGDQKFENLKNSKSKIVYCNHLKNKLAYSPLGTTVSPPSKTKPGYHLANVQRMHVVSVCLYYGKIIWLPWQHPVTVKVNVVWQTVQ